jgi:hypothetical protein
MPPKIAKIAKIARIVGAAKPATTADGATSAHEVGAVAHLPARTRKVAADLAGTVPMRANAHTAVGDFGSGERPVAASQEADSGSCFCGRSPKRTLSNTPTALAQISR